MDNYSRVVGAILCWILGLLPIFSQQFSIRGIVCDEMSENPLSSVNIALSDKSVATESGSDGAFILTGLKQGTYSVLFSATGYEDLLVEGEIVSSDLDLGTIKLKQARGQGLADLVISDLELETESEVQDIAPLLTSSHDVFNDVASYSLSPVRFRQRGYEGQYSDIYLNGLKMNDMNTGRVIWSLWGGLNDATRNQENYLGLENGDYALGNIGGVSNIVTRASKMRPQTRFTYSLSNRTYVNRAMFIYSSGLMNNGWAVSLSGSRRWGERGYVRGVFYDAFAYFLSVEKRFGDNHALALTALGSPTERGVSNGATQEVYDLTGFNYYNSNIGLQNNKWRNARVRESHEPLLLLNYYWQIDEQTKLTTSLGYRFGKNGYSALNWYDAPDPRPDYYRNLPGYYDLQGKTDQANEVREIWLSDPSTRYINWHRLYRVNGQNDRAVTDADGRVIANGKRAKYIIEDRRNDQRQLSASLLLNKQFSSKVKMDGGINLRTNKTANFKTIKDLLGADYWLDIDQFAERDFGSNNDLIQSDLNHPNRVVKKGDTYGYHYDANIREYDLWLLAAGNFYKYNLYGGLQIGNSMFHRTGYYRKGLFPDNSYGDSEKKSFLTYSAKVGGTYKISGRHYIAAHALFMQKAPYFADAFTSPRTRNTLVSNIDVEKILSGELNYFIRTPFVKGRLTGYYTRFMDQHQVMSFYDDYHRSFGNYVMSHIDKEHMGIEAGVEVKLSPTFVAKGVFGHGQYKYVSNPDYVQTVDNTEKVLESDRIYWDNFNISGTPMTVGNIGITYNSPRYWWISLSGNYFARSYIGMNPVLRTDRARAELAPEYIKQEKFDPGFTLDASAGISYRIRYKYYLSANLSVSNLLDNRTIKSGGYEQLRVNIDRDTNRMLRPFDSKYFYMFGRTFFLNVNFRF